MNLKLTALRKKIALFLTAAFLFIVVYFAIQNSPNIQQDKKSHETLVLEIYKASRLSEISDFHLRIDSARRFVNGNSVHTIDDEFYSKWHKPAMKQDFLDYVTNKSGKQPHMECSTRSDLLENLLQQSGYKTRRIVVYNTSRNLTSHTFIDVWNEEAGHWETQDPDFDIYWRDKHTKSRVPYEEVISDFTAYEPCSGKACGWHIKDPDDRSMDRFRSAYKIVSVLDGEKRYARFSSDTDPQALYSWNGRQGTFCAVNKDLCQDGFLAASAKATTIKAQ
jgi:hypothetical protein